MRGEKTNSSRTVLQDSNHAVGLSQCKKIHAGVVGVVHVVLRHRRYAASNLWMRRTAAGTPALIRRITDIVCSTAFAFIVSPSMSQAKEMCNLMGGCSSSVIFRHKRKRS